MHLTKTRGGISTLIAEILNSRLKEDFEFVYVATQAEDYGRFRKLLLAVTSLGKFVVNCVGMNANLVHVHIGSNASLYREGAFIFIARLLGKKVVGHFHAGDIENYYPSQPRIGKSFIRSGLGMCSRLIACSADSAKQLAALVPKNEITVIPNAIDVSSFTPKAKTSGSDPLKLLFVGAIGKLKGERDLLNALAALKKKGIRLSVSILGYGAEELGPICDELSISDMIGYLGAVPLAERIAHYEAADIFVLPTYAEAMPMSVIEAMAAGLAVVSTDVGGIPEIVTDGVNGLLVKPGDPNALAERVNALVEDPELRARLAANARRTALAEFDFAAYSKRLGEIFTGEIDTLK